MFFCCPTSTSGKSVDQENAGSAVVEVYSPPAEAPEPTPPPPQAQPVYEEPAKVEAAPEPEKPKSLAIEFNIGGGSTKVVEPTSRPLGLTFVPSTPVAVKKVEPGSVADKLGVQGGWIFTKIGGQSVASHADVTSMLKFGMEPLPVNDLIMEFVDQGNSVKTVAFSMKPLGLIFDKTTPFRVKKVLDGGNAQKLGVQPGWVFKTIAGKDVNSMSYNEVVKFIQFNSAPLSTTGSDEV